MTIDPNITVADVAKLTGRVFELAGAKARLIDRTWDASRGAPVFTVEGRYTARGWTEWTQGFQFGWPILVFDATDERDLLEIGRRNTLRFMASHVTHRGVHDHGFNSISTYGNLRRLMREGRIAHNEWEMAFYELALKASGAVQAMRWAEAQDGGGYIYSFNGPHSLFIDTIRTLRVLGVAHQLGHVLMDENDTRVSLLDRLVTHATTTARWNVYYGEGRDGYDIRGRVAHEAIFNNNDGRFRCPNSQQGYSPFSTWTRGLAWAVLGFAEEMEFLVRSTGFSLPLPPEQPEGCTTNQILEKAARATADFYIDHATAADGVPYWDTGAPGLHKLGDWQLRPADPFNEHEPVDSSAAAIAAQGLIRLGHHLGAAGARYLSAGLAVARTIFSPPYLSESAEHQGLILHSVYHRPNGWDHIPPGRNVPCGESSMWGDYHALELALLIRRLAANQPYLTFFDQ